MVWHLIFKDAQAASLLARGGLRREERGIAVSGSGWPLWNSDHGQRHHLGQQARRSLLRTPSVTRLSAASLQTHAWLVGVPAQLQRSVVTRGRARRSGWLVSWVEVSGAGGHPPRALVRVGQF